MKTKLLSHNTIGVHIKFGFESNQKLYRVFSFVTKPPVSFMFCFCQDKVRLEYSVWWRRRRLLQFSAMFMVGSSEQVNWKVSAVCPQPSNKLQHCQTVSRGSVRIINADH